MQIPPIPPVAPAAADAVAVQLANQLAPVMAIALVVVGVVVIYAIRTRARRHMVAAPMDPQILRPVEDRLGRLEQAVESIAVEMERVAEGQRFVTKLLAESRDQARLPAGQ